VQQPSPTNGAADSPNVRAALRAVYDAVRAGNGDPERMPDNGFDPAFVERTEPLLDFLWSSYFRVRLEGLENVPATGPALLVANHSGSLPYDGAMLIHALHRFHPSHRALRTLVANFAMRSRFMAPIISRVGGVRASMQNALALLKRGQLVGVFPEGLRGVGKLYRERYRLSHFGRGGFVRLAREAQVPIIPVAVVGAEEIHPLLGKMTRLARPFGLPYIPITPTFPLLGPLGLLPMPTKWSIQIGPPIAAPAADDAHERTLEIAEAVRRRVDQMIADLLVRRRSIIFG
jgi:1-acyl-sn-glycerol-3-phosphate acyltransferase